MNTPILDGIRKQARMLEVSDIESGLTGGGGRVRLRGAQLELAKKLVEEQYPKRFGLRHPWLTGIPTLGIWPAVSKRIAEEDVHEALSSKYKRLEELRNKALLEDEKLRYQRSMANSQSDIAFNTRRD